MAILKVKSILQSSFIRFGSDTEPLNLVDITCDADNANIKSSEFLKSAGTFVYESQFTVDESAAYEQGIGEILFEFFTSNPRNAMMPLKENTFRIGIPKPEYTPARDATALQQLDPKNIQKAVLYMKSPDVSTIVSSMLPIKAISNSQPMAEKVFRQAVKDSELYEKRDPAQILSAGKILGKTPSQVINFNSSVTTQDESKNFARVGAKNPSRSLSLHGVRNSLRDSRTSGQQNSLINSFLNLQEIVDPNSLVRTLPVTAVEVLSKNVFYNRHLIFNKKDLLGFNKLYMRVSGILRSGINAVVQRKIYTISHSSEVADFIGNPEPPVVVSSESSFGKVSFLLKKTDPTLRKVAVVRIIKNPNIVDVAFSKLGVVDFNDKDTITFSDSVDNVAPNTVIYRFIVQNDDGSCGEFTSSVVTSFTKVTDQKKVLTSTTPISIRALNASQGISISVDTINDQVYSFRLLRQDFGSTGEFSDTVKTILSPEGKYSTIVAGQKTTLEFVDDDVIAGRHYRYFGAYRLGNTSESFLCQETISDEDEIIIRIKPSNQISFSASVTPAAVTQDESNSITVNFDLVAEENAEIFNVLLGALRQAGVSEQFVTDLQNDRQKIRQVVAFLIERVDRVTGIRSSFGVYPPGKFEDSPQVRSKLNLQDPIPGRKYEYVCKMCIRPAQTFLLSATTGFVSKNDAQGNVTEVLAAKFQGALINRGILPSEKALRDGSPIRENFILGQTGIEISTTVTLPQFGPKVDNVFVRSKKFYNLLTWSVLGDSSRVSYFLVYCNYNGVDELLGAVSSLGVGSTYQYKDSRFVNEVGQKSYFVKLMTLDHDVTISSPKVETITNFSIPQAVLDGFILSPSRYNVQGVILPGIGPKGVDPIYPPPPPPPPVFPQQLFDQKSIGAGADKGINVISPPYSQTDPVVKQFNHSQKQYYDIEYTPVPNPGIPVTLPVFQLEVPGVDTISMISSAMLYSKNTVVFETTKNFNEFGMKGKKGI